MSCSAIPMLSSAVKLLQSPLHEPFQRFLDVCDDIHLRDENRNSLLHWAAAVGNVQAAFMLLQRGLDVDARNVYGATPLIVAAAFAPNVGAIASLFIAHGAALTVTLSGNDGATGVEEFLKARNLASTWEWLEGLSTILQQRGGASLFCFNGPFALPSTSSIKAAVPILCTPSEMLLIASYKNKEAPPVHPISNPLALPVPRAPLRRPFVSSSPKPSVSSLPASATSCDAPITAATASFSKESEAALILLCTTEYAQRLELEKEELEAFMGVYALSVETWQQENLSHIVHVGTLGSDSLIDHTPTSSPDHPGLAPSGDAAVSCERASRVLQVLGEKYDADGHRFLLVEQAESFEEAGGRCGNGPALASWCPLNAVAEDPVVRAYLDKRSRTLALTSSAAAVDAEVMLPSLEVSAAGYRLDTMERDQLEQQLRMLPRRDLSSPESMSSTSVSLRESHNFLLPIEGEGLKGLSKNSLGSGALLSPISAAGKDTAAHTSPGNGESQFVAPSITFHSHHQLARPLPPLPSPLLPPCPIDASSSFPPRSLASPAMSSVALGLHSATVPEPLAQLTLSQNRASWAPYLKKSSQGNSSQFAVGTSHLPQIQRPPSACFSQNTCTPFSDGSVSTDHTHAPIPSQNASTDSTSFKDPRFFLTETQQLRYNDFLRNSALQRLKKERVMYVPSRRVT